MASPLTTDYEVDWVDTEVDDLPEGVTHEHGYVHLDNGYTISLLRSNAIENHETLGYNEGKWEVAVGRPADGLFALLGMSYQPTPELDSLVTNEVHPEIPVAGPFDSAGVTGFISTIAEQQAYVQEESA